MTVSPTIRTFIEEIPKVDLHLHLDGSMRPQTIIELAEDQGVELPTRDLDALTEVLSPDPSAPSLEKYLEAFSVTTSVLGTPEALHRVAYELGEDCAAEGLIYIEVRYAPIFSVSDAQSQAEALAAIERGLREAYDDFGIDSRQIVCGMRNFAPDAVLKSAHVAVASRRDAPGGVAAFDLAGPEAGHPPTKHAQGFKAARDGLLGLTLHAGEAAGPAYVREALLDLGSHRIGHGTHIPDDPALLQHVADRGIPIEVCLTSNVQTGACGSIDTHPLRQMLDAGIRASICTDNRLISGTTVARELMLAVEHHDLTPSEIAHDTIVGLSSAFAGSAARTELLTKAEAAIRDVETRIFDERAR